MKTITLSLLLLLPSTVLAQTSRIASLQSARDLVLRNEGGQASHQLIRSGDSRMLYVSDGKIIAGSDTLDMKSTTIRLQTLPRFSVDEDSVAFSSKYSVDYGLLAFRRSLNVGRWNSLTVPFDLTAGQLRDAFGDDCQLLEYHRAVSSPDPALEFATVDLSDGDVVVVTAGNHYLLKPTREPDIAEGNQTSVVYGKAKVAGPVYAIANVTMASGQVLPKNVVLRSDDDEVRLRLRGHYAAYSVTATTRPRYLLNDEGYFHQLEEKVDEGGFRSWVEDANSSAHGSLRFYVDGIGEDLTEPTGINDVLRSTLNVQRYYDLQGRPVNVERRQKGIYIIQGKKIIIK